MSNCKLIAIPSSEKEQRLSQKIRVTTLLGAIQTRIHELMYKTMLIYYCDLFAIVPNSY